VSQRRQISVRATFERFPATLKGAFVIRGEDADPHLFVLRSARAVEIGGPTARPIEMAPVTLDVVPHRDLFVPFELPVSDLSPGWYELECDAEVDGTPETFPGGKRFVVAWPRATVRRGTVRIDETIALDDAKVSLDHLECTGDSTKLHLVVDPPAGPVVRLSADGQSLRVLDVELDEETGHCKVTSYPVMRSHSRLRVDVGIGRGRRGTVEVDL